MYAVRRWDEEAVIKWLAVAMVLAMVGLAVMPANISGIGIYLLIQWKWIEGGLATGSGLATIGGAIYAYATVETLTTLVLVGIGLTGDWWSYITGVNIL